MKKFIIILISALLILAGATIIKYYLNSISYITLNLNYSESTDDLQNPERGWYLINSCMVSDNAEEGNAIYENLQQQHQEGDTLVLILFNISNYRNQEISEAGLQYITNTLVSVKKAGMKAIVRFVYDWNGNGLEQDPSSMSTIFKHMEQVSPILNKNKSAIYLLQGIFVGSYGEMHSSKYLEDENNIITLLGKYLELTDDDLLHSVRTPAYWRLVTQSNEPVMAFNGSPGTRVGLFNDGLCSSDIDLGTYADGTEQEHGYSTKWDRAAELTFQSELCLYVPNGGEVALDSEFNDITQIVKTFPIMHISYLNRGYNSEVLNKWKESTYQSDIDGDPYQGLDGYKYIQDHLGYRYVLREVSVPKVIYKYSNPVLSMKIENTGFANLYDEKQLSLILKSEVTGNLYSFPVDTDIRYWRSGNTTEVNVKLSLKGIDEGHYLMYFMIEDENGSSIAMSNPRIYDTSMMANKTGEIDIKNITLESIWSK